MACFSASWHRLQVLFGVEKMNPPSAIFIVKHDASIHLAGAPDGSCNRHLLFDAEFHDDTSTNSLTCHQRVKKTR
jgi:hypothetical protein